MSKYRFWPGIALVALLPGTAGAQVVIDHKAPGCIVAGKFPKMNACFTPASALARSRVNFRIDGTPNWYFVDMKSDAPCFQGILPKLKKNMSGRKLQFYIDATDKSFAEARTAEFEADIVANESECKKDVPAAPFANNASVVVGSAAGAPAAPFGFAVGGLSTGLVVGVVGAGLVTTGAIVATNGGDDATPTTQPPSTTPLVTNPPPPVTTQPAPTTQPPTVNRFNAVFRVFPNPPAGRSPLQVTFDMCESTGNNLRFTFDFENDGVEDRRGQCSASRVYTATQGPPPSTNNPGPQVVTFVGRVCVIEPNGPRECREFVVEVLETASLVINSLDAAPASRRLAWASHLEVEGGAGQVVVNGEAASFAARGRSTAVAMGRRGENRVEAQLVQAAGRPGVWRFDLGSTGSLSRGSIRVIAGEVAMITPDAIVFRVKGQPGERIVFSFRTGN